MKEVKAKRLPELDDEFASDAGGFDTLAELREDIAARLRESEERAIEREFEQAVLDAAVAEAEVEVPDKLVHARAHELLDETLTALARQGISKETYLRIAGKDEETLAHEAEPEAAQALKREAVLAAVVEAEGIEPTDDAGPRGARADGRAHRVEPRQSCSSSCARATGSSRFARGGRQPRGARAARPRGEADQRRAGQGPREAVDARQGRRRARGRAAVDAGRLTADAGPDWCRRGATRRLLHSAGIRPRKRKKRGR